MIVFILASIGMTLAIVESKLFSWPKNILSQWSLIATKKQWMTVAKLLQYTVYLFNCYQCSGFWCGVVMGYVLNIPINFLALGFMSSFLSTMAAGLLNILDKSK